MATPVPPPAPRLLRLLRLLLSGLALGAALRGAAAAPPDGAACPGSLDCALKRRARCPPGAHACGPCLQPFQEDHTGLCVPPLQPPVAGAPPRPRLEDDIDLLAQKLAQQEAGRWKLPALSQTQTQAPLQRQEPAVTLGLSSKGQGPGLGLPSTLVAPAPSPRSSLGAPVHVSPLDARPGHLYGLALVLILAGSVAGVAAVAVAAFWWCRLQRDIRLTQKMDYTAQQAASFPPTPRTSPGDQRLAQSAEVYHYQHQRQQLQILDRHKEPPKELDEENEDGDFTVYECPGLAPTGEMEVRNPLFDQASLAAPLPPLPPPPK
ncbi:neural proliferation differentiation and control protein 1 isoform X1 [Pipistrellus kuhlii]|uniref:neural proliferation differentiation and control protein 1 isoform X1 n=1 Tax=Pipistrellus kuhlii TaxID=59472 RepID=UPI00174F5466|nr:neural proliferation differentiation and control protein 1 isoform X1 [Pipistrellus kuhlii]